MMLATLLQAKCEEVYYENITEDSIWKKCTAILAAMFSGGMDAAVILYPFVHISLEIANRKLAKLKNSVYKRAHALLFFERKIHMPL